MALELQRWLFTVAEYRQMAEYGILNEDARVELIEGAIIEMNPICSRHAACVRRFAQLLFQRVGDRAIVSVQDPIQLNDRSEPQPDLTLLRPRADFYRDAHPGPDDAFLLVEVADRSLAYDRDVKLPLYARSGIPEVWIIDLESRTVTVYRDPSPQGYRETVRPDPGTDLSLPGLPGTTLDTDQILG